MPLNTRKFTDLNLSFMAHPIKKDVSKLVDEADIKESIKNLVFTRPFEKPFHPEIGCEVWGMLFENISPLTSISIKRSIENVIQNFEPRVELLETQVKVVPDLNAYEATIVFNIINRPGTVKFTFLLERLR